MFKKIAIFIFVFTLLCANVYAHSGGTDWRGGHNDNSTGGYHYHHGYPEHQHSNGICPYDDRYSNYAIIEKDQEDDYDYEEESDYEEEFVAIDEKEEKRKEEAETNKYIWIYTIIGLLITLTNLLSVFRDSFKMNRKTKEPIFVFLISASVVLAMAIFAYWILYAISFRISKSLFKDDVIITHICANIPTFFMIYYVVKGRKKGEQS